MVAVAATFLFCQFPLIKSHEALSYDPSCAPDALLKRRCYFTLSDVGGWVGYVIYTSVYLACVEIGVRPPAYPAAVVCACVLAAFSSSLGGSVGKGAFG